MILWGFIGFMIVGYVGMEVIYLLCGDDDIVLIIEKFCFCVSMIYRGI